MLPYIRRLFYPPANSAALGPIATPVSSPLNMERLRPGIQLELLVREPPAPDSLDDQLTRSVVRWFPLLIAIAFGALPLVATVSGPSYLVVSALAIFAVRFLWPGLADGQAIARARGALFYVLSVALVVSFIGKTFMLGTFGVFVAMVFFARVVAIESVDVYRRHLLADPRIPEEQAATFAKNSQALLILGFGPLVLPLLLLWAIDARSLGGLVIGAVVLGSTALAFRPISVRQFLEPYLFYDGYRSQAPGIWRPGSTLSARRQWTAMFGALLFLSLYIPLQLLSPTINQDFNLPRANVIGTIPDQQIQSYADAASAVRVWPLPEPQQATTAEVGGDIAAVAQNAFLALVDTGRIFVNATIYVIPIAIFAAGFVYLSLLPLLLALGYFTRKVTTIAETMDPKKPDDSLWLRHVDRVELSDATYADPITGAEIRERDHMFLGYEPTSGFPVLLHRPLLREHCYISGDSGSGKTALGIIPLVFQAQSDDTPIVIFDLKGDPALFHGVKAASAGRDFRFFRPDTGAETYHFNPLQNFGSTGTSDMQLCQTLLDALSLNHGEGYGRSYYSKRSRQLLLDAMRPTAGMAAPTSLAELSARLSALSLRGRDEAFELFATIETLSRYSALGAAPARNSIHMPTVLDHKQVVYFWLPAAVESMSVREIAKMALFSLLTAAIDRQAKHLPTQNCLVVIDEFQRIAGENFKVLLEQARSFGIGMILANQSLSDLDSPAGDLRSTVSANTRTKMYFSVTQQQELDALSKASGESVEIRRGWSLAATPEEHRESLHNLRTDSFTEAVRPRLTSNDIRRISDHPLQFLLHVSRGSGLTQFGGLVVPVRTMFPQTQDRYNEFFGLGAPGQTGLPPLLTSASASPARPAAAKPSSAATSEAPAPPQPGASSSLPINTVGPKEAEEQTAAVMASLWETLRAKDRRGTDKESASSKPGNVEPIMRARPLPTDTVGPKENEQQDTADLTSFWVGVRRGSDRHRASMFSNDDKSIVRQEATRPKNGDVPAEYRSPFSLFMFYETRSASELIRLAESKNNNGDWRPHFSLAIRLLDTGGPENDAQAFRSLLAAANQGHRTAMKRVSLLYERGRGTEQDLEAAEVWRHRWLDSRETQSELATLRWVRIAADRGNKEAMFQLMERRWLRVLTPSNRSDSWAERRYELWLRDAAEGGHEDAQWMLDTLRSRRQ